MILWGLDSWANKNILEKVNNKWVLKDGNNLMKNIVIIDYGMGNLHSISMQ